MIHENSTRNTRKKVKMYPKYFVKSSDYQKLFDKWPKEAINYSPPGNNENRTIKILKGKIQHELNDK